MKRQPDGELLWGVIVETETYSQEDPACHGYRRRSLSNETLFGEPGRFYQEWHASKEQKTPPDVDPKTPEQSPGVKRQSTVQWQSLVEAAGVGAWGRTFQVRAR